MRTFANDSDNGNSTTRRQFLDSIHGDESWQLATTVTILKCSISQLDDPLTVHQPGPNAAAEPALMLRVVD